MSQANPPTHFMATVKIRPGKMLQFSELMPRIVAVMEQHGWRLLGAWTTIVGRLNVVTDLWQIPDANALPSGFGALMMAHDWPDIDNSLAECVEDEVLQIMVRAPFDPGRI
ncbi:MAG: NIPSNAP family protein [Pseudomonadota bacterium]|nr:NIPSNAP family protein [Pseudomonadota bacterium]